jgi:hypothetical protein
MRSGGLSFSYLAEILPNHENDKNSHYPLPKAVQDVKEIFEKNTRFKNILISATPPAKGLHVNIYQERPLSFTPYEIASIITMGVIPYYMDGVAYTVHFDVLLDNTPIKTYEEKISHKGITWIGFLPFWWITHIVNTSEEEAFLSTVYNFTKAARQDGLLEPPETYSSLNPSSTGYSAAQRAGK